MYSFASQVAALGNRFHCLMTDRGGYGRSTQLTTELPPDFHYHAARETLQFMDSFDIERAVLWGHSDGAVIAAILGFTAPERVEGLILEAFHYYAQKLRSRDFFEMLVDRPEVVGDELCNHFARELGQDYWRQLITTHARAWIQLGQASKGPRDDLYVDRLREIKAPALFIHGGLDPRTEPGEMEDVQRQLPSAEVKILDLGAHSPHSEIATADEVTALARDFLQRLAV